MPQNKYKTIELRIGLELEEEGTMERKPLMSNHIKYEYEKDNGMMNALTDSKDSNDINIKSTFDTYLNITTPQRLANSYTSKNGRLNKNFD